MHFAPPIKTTQIRASDQLRALPLTSLLSASLFRGNEWKNAPGSVASVLLHKSVFYIPPAEKTAQFDATTQRETCKMKDEPPNRHIVATAGLPPVLPALTQREERAKETLVSTSLDPQEKSPSCC